MILGQEGDSEFVINRQNAKLQILSQENNNLQEDIKDLQSALKFNKQALRLAMEQQGQKFPKNQQANSFSITVPQFQNDTKEFYNEIFEKLENENTVLKESLNRVMKDRNEGTTKSLLQEQINEETTNFYKDVIQEFEEKVLELRRIIQDKEYTIQTLERKLNLPDKEGVLLKIRDVISPSEQCLALHNEIENLKELNEKITHNLETASNENTMLQEVNRDLPLYQKFFREMMQENEDPNHEKNGNQNTNQNQNQLQQQQSIKPQFSTNQQLKSPRSPRSRTELLEKMEGVQNNLTKFKKLYVKAQKNNQMLLESLNQQQKHIESLTINRDSLIKSNLAYQQKSISQNKEIKFLKYFFTRYMLRAKNQRNRSLLNLTADNYQNNLNNKTNNQNKFQNNNNQQQQKYISSKELIEKINENFQEQQKKQEDLRQSEQNYQMNQINKECCIQILKNLKQEVQQLKHNINIVINSNKGEQTFIRYRSISNPLDYFTVELEQKPGFKDYKRKLPIINEEEESKQQYGSKKNAPFLLDVSMIQGENQKKKSKQKPIRYVPSQKKFLIDASFISNDGGEMLEFK